MSLQTPELLAHFAALAEEYDVILSDVWGVVHNGIAAHPVACDALARFRGKGGRVVLITNAPRPNDSVARQIAGFGVPKDCYDGIVSSGDVTRAEVIARADQS
ncbi:MAG: TIGR01459 family HAD-type hydrolase, partial [Pseudolabrys sp.]|nr:TIGR01459 family HAD-type hydrolase [Pseudolabrys sp.]